MSPSRHKSDGETSPGVYWAVFLLLAGIVAYFNSADGAFVLDDAYHIEDNKAIERLWPPGELLFRTHRPVIMLSLALNYAFGKREVFGYHAVNLGIHILAVFTLYGILRRTFQMERLRSRFHRHGHWIALISALIWSVHPLQTQAVTYVIQRCESLMGLFYLLTLYCFIRYAQEDRKTRWAVSAAVCCCLGMGCKEVMVTAPITVLLYDRLFLSDSFKQSLNHHWRMYAGLVLSWVILGLILAQPTATEDDSAGFGIKGLTTWEYARTQPEIILHYLRLCFIPYPQVFDYLWPVEKDFLRIATSGITVTGLMGVSVWLYIRKNPIGFAGVWFFLILAPSSSIMPIKDLAFEHRMYLSLAGVIVVVIILFDRILGINHRAAAATALTLATGGIFTFLTIQRNRDYRSETDLWRTVVERRPENWRAFYNLGQGYAKTQEWESAIPFYQESTRLKPDHEKSYEAMGIAYYRQGRMEAARRYYEKAIEVNPTYAGAYYNLGVLQLNEGQTEVGIENLEKTIALNPHHLTAYYTLADRLAQEGKTDRAISLFQYAWKNQPWEAMLPYRLGGLLLRQKRVTEAAACFQEALRLKPDWLLPKNNLAWIYATSSDANCFRPAEALRLADQIRKQIPNPSGEILDTIAAAYAANGQYDQAVAVAVEALRNISAEGNSAEVQTIRNRLERYRQKQPYRE